MPKLQSNFYRIASAEVVKKNAVGWQLCAALAPEQPWDNGAPNAKASIQLLPDCFRWIGEIKVLLDGKALLALAPEQPLDNGVPNAKASIQLLPDRFRWIGEIKAPLDGKALCRFATVPEQPGVMHSILYRSGYCPS